LLGGLDSGDDVGAGVGCHVEDGVDHEGKEGKGNLAGEEPDECHCCHQHLSASHPGQSFQALQWGIQT